MPRFPPPHTSLKSGRSTFRFYLGDCLDLLERLPPGSVDTIVTSPPYNLGIQYRTYDDTIPRDRYLAWTGEWVKRAAGALSPSGSLFLNVGAKPTDPWTAMDVAQFVTKNMPPDEADREEMNTTEYWSVLAFALSANGVALEQPVSASNAPTIVLHP